MSYFCEIIMNILHSNGSAIYENSNYLEMIAYWPFNLLLFSQCILRLENRTTLEKMTKLNKKYPIEYTHCANKTHVILTNWFLPYCWILYVIAILKTSIVVWLGYWFSINQ